MKTKQILLIIAAIIVGEIALIILTTIAQEVLFNGISYSSSSRSTLIFGGAATALAAVGAGFLARLVKKTYSIIVPIGMSVFIITEMTFLITSDRTGDPVWFDIIAGSSLIIGVWLGYHYKSWISYFSFKPAQN